MKGLRLSFVLVITLSCYLGSTASMTLALDSEDYGRSVPIPKPHKPSEREKNYLKCYNACWEKLFNQKPPLGLEYIENICRPHCEKAFP